jgi:glycosyltransferase involved in cell wall biosynthesis
MSDFKISICCLAYNHESYIKQCLDGFVMQKCNFTFEILIHDDASKDNTASIIKDYEAKYPDIIKPIYQIENQHSKGVKPTFAFNFPRAQGKYIALCEGDDYWTDPYKLQKQVDFLEANPDYGICAHVAKTENEINLNKIDDFPNIIGNHVFSIKDYINNNLTATASLVFRSDFYKHEPWHNQSPFGDLLLVLSILKNTNKKMFVFKDVMSVYRIHNGGIHGSLTQDKKSLVKAYKQHIKFTNLVSKYLFKNQYRNELILKKLNTYKIIFNLLGYRNSFFNKLYIIIMIYIYKFKSKSL